MECRLKSKPFCAMSTAALVPRLTVGPRGAGDGCALVPPSSIATHSEKKIIDNRG